jgi:hypothetical protein
MNLTNNRRPVYFTASSWDREKHSRVLQIPQYVTFYLFTYISQPKTEAMKFV